MQRSVFEQSRRLETQKPHLLNVRLVPLRMTGILTHPADRLFS
jgi:hypothetical protein